MTAPNFSLPDQDGQVHTLSQYKGNWVVLYFYPKDDTPGCTKEACGFRDAYQEFTKRGVAIIGISKDSVASHKKFADKYHLMFPILSDPDHAVMEKFGAWGSKKFMGREFFGVLRNTYIINPEGIIVKTYERVNPLVHAKEIIHDIDLFIG